jgi:MoaA/NifB/PqqE/SkfB family radical SAM enzyme
LTAGGLCRFVSWLRRCIRCVPTDRAFDRQAIATKNMCWLTRRLGSLVRGCHSTAIERIVMTPLERWTSIAAVHVPILLKAEAKRLWPAFFNRIPIRPSSAWLNPTDNCNMGCIMCNQWRDTKTDELTTSEWKDVIRQLAREGIQKVGLNGGEPLLRKDVSEIISYITSLGMKPLLITSGFLLDEQKMADLVGAGLQHVMVSIDGVGAEYEKIRNRKWPRVENAARIVARYRKEGKIDAAIAMVVMKETLDHVASVRDFCRDLELPMVASLVDGTPFFMEIPENAREAANWVGEAQRPKLRRVQETLVEMKRDSRDSLVNTYVDIDYMSAYFRDPLQQHIPCTVSQLRIMINSHGEVYGGCWSMGSYGCLRQQSLREIINSPRYRQAHRDMFYKACPGCSVGYMHNTRYSLPMQLRNLVFKLVPGKSTEIYAEKNAVR